MIKIKKVKIFIFLLLPILIFTACSKKEEEFAIYGLAYEYVTGVQEFKFEYPVDWTIEIDDPSAGRNLPDGLPEYGVNIYMDSSRDNWIYIFEGISPNMHRDDSYTKEDFIVNNRKKGDLYTKEEGGNIYKLVFFEKDKDNPAYRYTLVKAEKKLYKKNKETIRKVLESIDF